MLIKSPMKKDKVKRNKRGRKKSNGKAKNIRPNKRIQNGSQGKRKKSREKKGISFPSLEPWKVIFGAVVLGGLGILYLNHVFATQKLLKEVNQLEGEYQQVKRIHSDYRLTYDRMIGPAEIYEKAKTQGFINGGPAEKVIEVEK